MLQGGAVDFADGEFFEGVAFGDEFRNCIVSLRHIQLVGGIEVDEFSVGQVDPYAPGVDDVGAVDLDEGQVEEDILLDPFEGGRRFDIAAAGQAQLRAAEAGGVLAFDKEDLVDFHQVDTARHGHPHLLQQGVAADDGDAGVELFSLLVLCRHNILRAEQIAQGLEFLFGDELDGAVGFAPGAEQLEEDGGVGGRVLGHRFGDLGWGNGGRTKLGVGMVPCGGGFFGRFFSGGRI